MELPGHHVGLLHLDRGLGLGARPLDWEHESVDEAVERIAEVVVDRAKTERRR